jgi:hypothetical protein
MKFQISKPDGTKDVVTDLNIWIAANNVPIAGKIRDARRYPTLAGLPILKGYAGPVLRGSEVHYYVPREQRVPRFGDIV